jgi:hypothetical protein
MAATKYREEHFKHDGDIERYLDVPIGSPSLGLDAIPRHEPESDAWTGIGDEKA